MDDLAEGAGETEGVAEGAGETEGAPEGASDGMVEGTSVGKAVGSGLGGRDGMAEGAGESEGAADGETEGEALGLQLLPDLELLHDDDLDFGVFEGAGETDGVFVDFGLKMLSFGAFVDLSLRPTPAAA